MSGRATYSEENKMYEFIQIIIAFVYGVVEGITEWLPVSSTGHLIILENFLNFSLPPDKPFTDEFCEMFEVVIQLGAIMAVVVTFISQLWPFSRKKTKEERRSTFSLWLNIIIASIPAAIVGLVLDKVIEKLTSRDIDGWLYNSIVVAAALIIYGVLFIVIEKINKNKEPKISSIDEIKPHNAFLIGVFQMLAIIPGTSRSGSTVLGAMLLGLSRPVAAQFSFFLAVPAMAGASLIKAAGFFSYVAEREMTVPTIAWVVLAVGALVAFLVSMLAIKFLTGFVKKHSFSAFGVYRIALGLLVILLFALGVI